MIPSLTHHDSHLLVIYTLRLCNSTLLSIITIIPMSRRRSRRRRITSCRGIILIVITIWWHSIIAVVVIMIVGHRSIGDFSRSELIATSAASGDTSREED